MMSIFLSGCMLTSKLQSTIMHVVNIPLLKCKSKNPADVNNYKPIAIALSKVLEQVLLSRPPGTCGLQTANLISSKHVGQKWPCLHSSKLLIFTVIRSHLYTCAFLMQKRRLIFNQWTLAKKLLDRDVPLHIVKWFIFWYIEQEFMVRWSNSLSMTFRCSNGIRQGGQLSPLLYNVYTDFHNHHLQATGVGCYVGGAWVNSLSYADDMVLLAPTVTALQPLLEIKLFQLALMTLYTTQRKQYVCWSGQSNHRVGS